MYFLGVSRIVCISLFPCYRTWWNSWNSYFYR